MTSTPGPPELGAAVPADVEAIKDAIATWRAPYDPCNFSETAGRADNVLPASSYERLRHIKATYDPDQTIISAHPVQPARL